MYVKFPIVGLLAMLMIVVMGCSIFRPEERSKVPPQPQIIGKGGGEIYYDDLLAKVAQQVPAFGGMFLDAQDNSILYVYLLDPTQKEAAEKAIVEIFGPIWPDIIPTREVRVLQGQYSFLQLKQWKDMVGIVMTMPGVVTLDIDDKRNRLSIGLERMDIAAQVEKELSRLGIPREAVIFEETGPYQHDKEKSP